VRVCVHRDIAHMYINIYVYIVFLKKNKEAPPPSYLNLLLRHLLMLQVVPLKDYYLNECFHETSELPNLLKLLEQSCVDPVIFLCKRHQAAVFLSICRGDSLIRSDQRTTSELLSVVVMASNFTSHGW
jgi:hypothetical protein